MAQPVFDEHPLEEYFRVSGESMEVMPGGAIEFAAEQEYPPYNPYDNHIVQLLSPLVMRLIELIEGHLPSSQFASQQYSFAERFKYDVISSSLLSASITAPSSANRRTFTPDIPGRLDRNSNHSRSSSDADSADAALPMGRSPLPLTTIGVSWPIGLASVALVALSAGHYILCIPLLSCVAYVLHVSRSGSEKSDVMTMTLNAVNDLISAGNVWDSAVNEAITILEKEERSVFYGPTSPRSPSSSLRIALQSSLHTSQNQCDNVRILLSALTSPTQAAQLSEMYAPASPIKPTFSILDHPRPVSLPHIRDRTISAPTTKRATWNGSYAALALAGNPPFGAGRREKRRSDLSTVMGNITSSVSAPPSPNTSTRLADVQESDERQLESQYPKEHFGAAALTLQRKRRTSGMEVFGVPPPSYSSQVNVPHVTSPLTQSSSRFTHLQTTRHPLSMSALHMALHGALAAKRYACSHLLALRFEEDEDDVYWENVRSVMALLTSTFADASSRLMEALDEAEKKRMRDERPSPVSETPILNLSPPPQTLRPARSMADMISFAPMPSHLTRFAAHVDAISSALNDARGHLEQCVSTLRQSPNENNIDEVQAIPPSLSPDNYDGGSEPTEPPPLQAYDRLRKELSYALRECERGRERLLEVLAASHPAPASNEMDLGADDTPLLRQDTGSDASDQAGPSSPLLQSTLAILADCDASGQDLDDATEHLLLTSSSLHLPSPGVEQVFEADSGNDNNYTRLKSKLPREERIRLAKARRESGVSNPVGKSSMEMWGPGGEVVQELKDVIWKVSEKRRKMSIQPGTRETSTLAAELDLSREDRLRTWDGR